MPGVIWLLIKLLIGPSFPVFARVGGLARRARPTVSHVEHGQRSRTSSTASPASPSATRVTPRVTLGNPDPTVSRTSLSPGSDP